MTKRLLTIISGQPLPNYIAINELKPDVVHCIYTSNMKPRFDALKSVVQEKYPTIQFEEHAVIDPYDSLAVGKVGIELLDKFSNDEWHLNRSAGTEQMRAPLTAAFFEKFPGKFVTFFVESEKNQIAWISAAWARTEEAFKNSISVIDYFRLHGQTVKAGDPVNGTEKHLYNDLQRLSFDNLVASCKWTNHGIASAEYDIAATWKYRLYVFERKKLHVPGRYAAQTLEEQDMSVQHDIEKLAYTRAIFGGPYGQVYWLLSGTYVPKESIINRMKPLSIHYLRGDNITNIVRDQQQLGLPPPR